METLLHILNSLPDGLFTIDWQFKINFFNHTAEQITGVSQSQALGRPCKDIFRGSVCEAGCTLKQALRKGENIYNREFMITRQDGSSIPVICSTSVLKDQDGNFIGAVEAFKDITDRKRLESDLRISEKKYRRIFEGSKDMIFITSKEGAFKDVNQAGVDLLGYGNKQELLSLVSVLKVYYNPMHRKVFQEQIERHGYVKDFEATLMKKDGTPIHCLLTGNAVRGADGEIIGYEGIVKDITARMDAVRNLRQRHRELSLLNSVAVAMNATQNLDDILMTALKRVLDLLNLSSGAIFLIDYEKSAFSCRVKQNFSECNGTDANRIVLHDEILMRSLFDKDLSLVPEPAFPPFRASLENARGGHTVRLTCFLITAQEKARGFLALEVPPDRELTEQDSHLLGSLGNFLGGAIENARLHQTINQHREELKRLTAKLFHTQERERRRIARELHDEAGQALTGINFTLQMIEKKLSPPMNSIKEHISSVKKQINRTYQELRRISYRLHPALLSDLGLEPALDAYLTNISKHSELKIDFRMVGFDERLDMETETTLYRLSQEALTNTLKHSRASHFKLSIIKSYPSIIFLAEDDGIGFEESESNGQRQALGLLSMRERSAMLDGTFSLRSLKGAGTLIRIEIPVKGSCHA